MKLVIQGELEYSEDITGRGGLAKFGRVCTGVNKLRSSVSHLFSMPRPRSLREYVTQIMRFRSLTVNYRSFAKR